MYIYIYILNRSGEIWMTYGEVKMQFHDMYIMFCVDMFELFQTPFGVCAHQIVTGRSSDV